MKIPEFLREFGKGHSLGHIHATNAVAMDAVVEWWVIQSGIRLELFHKVPRFICNLPLSYGKIQKLYLNRKLEMKKSKIIFM